MQLVQHNKAPYKTPILDCTSFRDVRSSRSVILKVPSFLTTCLSFISFDVIQRLSIKIMIIVNQTVIDNGSAPCVSLVSHQCHQGKKVMLRTQCTSSACGTCIFCLTDQACALTDSCILSDQLVLACWGMSCLHVRLMCVHEFLTTLVCSKDCFLVFSNMPGLIQMCTSRRDAAPDETGTEKFELTPKS